MPANSRLLKKMEDSVDFSVLQGISLPNRVLLS